MKRSKTSSRAMRHLRKGEKGVGQGNSRYAIKVKEKRQTYGPGCCGNRMSDARAAELQAATQEWHRRNPGARPAHEQREVTFGHQRYAKPQTAREFQFDAKNYSAQAAAAERMLKFVDPEVVEVDPETAKKWVQEVRSGRKLKDW